MCDYVETDVAAKWIICSFEDNLSVLAQSNRFSLLLLFLCFYRISDGGRGDASCGLAV